MRISPSGRGPRPDDSQLDGPSDRPSNGTLDGPIIRPSNGTLDGPIDRPSNGTLGPGDGDRGDGKAESKGIHAEFLKMKAYYLKYEYREQDVIWGVSMILICILLIAICMSLNMHVFRFYRKKFKQDVVSLLYSLLSLADILVATGSFVTVICLVLYLTLDLEAKDMDFVDPSVKYLCYISFFISSIAIRISIFLNALLSIVRTIMIKNPFYETSKRGICLAVAFVTLFWTITAAAEVYTQDYINIEAHWTTFETEISEGSDLGSEEEYLKNRKQYLYLWYYIYTSAAGFYCTLEFLGSSLPWSVGFYNVKGDVDGDDLKQSYSENFALYGMFLIAFVIPCLIAIVCLIIKAVILSKPSVGGTQNNNKVVTNTIMMLTLVFVICNTINIIVISLAMFYGDWFELDETGIKKDDDVIRRFYRTMFAVQQVLPLLNSTLSPMILIWRGTALRKSFVETFHKVLPSRRGGTNTIASSVTTKATV